MPPDNTIPSDDLSVSDYVAVASTLVLFIVSVWLIFEAVNGWAISKSVKVSLLFVFILLAAKFHFFYYRFGLGAGAAGALVGSSFVLSVLGVPEDAFLPDTIFWVSALCVLCLAVVVAKEASREIFDQLDRQDRRRHLA